MDRLSHQRVLMAADIGSGCDTGLGRHQWYLAQELKNQGYRVKSFCAEDATLFSKQQVRRFYFPFAVLCELIRAEIAGDAYGTVVAHEGCAAFACLGKRVRLHRAVCIVVSHNPEQKVWERDIAFAAMDRKPLPWSSQLLWPATRLVQSNYALRAADYVGCLSSEDFAYLRDQMRIDPGKISLLANGVEEKFFTETERIEQPRILFLGSWLPHKGKADFAQAINQLLLNFPQVTITIAGTGVGAEAVRKDFRQEIAGKLEIVPHVAPEELPKIYAENNIFVLPSWYEGMPLSLLEAMAAELAPVVTAVGGMKDVVRDGLEGIVVPPRAPTDLLRALGTLCSNREKRASMAIAARKRARTYSWTRAGKLLGELIQNSLAIHAEGLRWSQKAASSE